MRISVPLIFDRQVRLSLGLMLCAWVVPNSVAAQQRVPGLPSTDFDYVGYAVTNLPDHFASPDLQNTNNTPVDNPITNAGATLGRTLFYDKQLSHDGSIACASCHQQATGFGDTRVKSQGVNGQTGRHSMALSNVGYYTSGKAFWDERADSLEDQALMPIQDPIEMNLDLATLVTRLENTPFYAQLFQNAFGTPQVTTDRIAKAIAQFERSMVSYQSPFDQAHVDGFLNTDLLTPAQLAGFDIFHGGQGECRVCHISPAQIGDQARNIGLDPIDTDVGAGDGRFKTPSLRNAEVRGRFMHDGRFATLEEVIEFYSTGVNENNPNVDSDITNRNFTQQEKDDLLAFLQSLTDWNFLTDEKFSDPFVFLCDFNADDDCGVDDLNTLLAEGPIAGGITVNATNRRYDLDFDGDLDLDDLELWLSEAALVDGLASPYKLGDANLDGIVDGEDFQLWNQAKFTSSTDWDNGDFNGDGLVNGVDFLLWNQSKFTSSASATVPEPNSMWLAAVALVLWCRLRR